MNFNKLHATKHKNPVTGKTTFSAYHQVSGEPISIINDYILSISESVSYNSLSSKFYSLKKFYEYLDAAFESLIHLEDFNFQPAIFTILKAYPNYLFAPLDTQSEFYLAVRKITGHTPISKSSINTEVSHINGFLKESHSVSLFKNEDDNEILKLNRFDLHQALLSKKKASANQLLSMSTGTVLGAVIRKTRTDVTNWVYMEVPRNIRVSKTWSGENLKAFPFDHFVELLKVSDLREKLLYTILGGAGLRTHEALQIRTNDFDTDGNLLIRDFTQRKLLDELGEFELSELYASKGRNIEQVFWIPSYENIFHQLLKLYLGWRDEQLRRGGLDDHGFLFVTSTHPPGRPLYDTQRSSHINTFNRNAGLVGLEGFGKHSLRHMYGVYMLNYFPTENGNGLSIQQVNKLMGHSTLKATEIYAQIDKNELFKLIEDANTQNELIQWEKSLNKNNNG